MAALRAQGLTPNEALERIYGTTTGRGETWRYADVHMTEDGTPTGEVTRNWWDTETNQRRDPNAPIKVVVTDEDGQTQHRDDMASSYLPGVG